MRISNIIIIFCLCISILIAVTTISYLEIRKSKREDMKTETDCAIRRKYAGLREVPPQNNRKEESTHPAQPLPRRMLSAAIDAAALVVAKALGSSLATSIAEWLKPKT